MRTFFLALAVLLLIVFLLIFAGRYLIKRTAELTKAILNLPPLTDDISSIEKEALYRSLEDFTRIWNSTRKTVHFLVGHDEADRIDETLSELRTRYVTHDTAGYMSAREKLLRSISRLAESEAFSFDTIT